MIWCFYRYAYNEIFFLDPKTQTKACDENREAGELPCDVELNEMLARS